MLNDSDSNNVVELRGASKTYSDGAVGLRPVSLRVAAGEFVSIMGPSGCGKSTVLKLIAGLDTPTLGTVRAPQHVSVVFQGGALFPWLDVAENVAFGLRMRGVAHHAALGKTHRFLEMLGLGAYAHKYPRDLSGGQRQRVGIARALAVEPELLLLDEPFSALDETTRFALYDDLLALWKEHGLTIVIVSHQVDESVFLAQRTLLMQDHELRHVVENPLPYPRDPGSSAFARELAHLRGLLPKHVI
jgi:ABC-type nitrate/sulfonate/bicarbonate transport system ATPase subunit